MCTLMVKWCREPRIRFIEHGTEVLEHCTRVHERLREIARDYERFGMKEFLRNWANGAS